MFQNLSIITYYYFQRMEEQRLRHQGELRARHENEVELSNRARQNINEQHNRLRTLVDGGQMRPAHEYKPPPNWQPPQRNQPDPWGGNQGNQGFYEYNATLIRIYYTR